MRLYIRCGIFSLCSTLILAGTNASGETLQDAVAEVLLSNPQVRAQAYNRLGRDQEVRQAKSGYLPSLDVIAGVGAEDTNEPAHDSLNPNELRILLRQNLFTGFATENEVDRQEARVRSAAYTLQGVSENLALDASRVYLEVLRQEELKMLAEENLLTHQRIADQIRLRSESGVGSQVDLEQIGGRVALAESNVVVTETNLQDARSRYQAVVGQLPGDLLKPEIPGSLIPVTLEDAEKAALAGHPTLKSAEADLEARQEQYEVAKSPFYPKVDVEVQQYWDEDMDGEDSKKEGIQAMLRLRYNLFNGYGDEARKAETLELIEEAREIKNNTGRQVVESIRLSWMAHQSVLDRMKYLEAHVDASKATSEAYLQQFNIGKRTLLDVLDTEAEVIEAKGALINADYDGLYSQYRLLNGMGMMAHALGLQWPAESVVPPQDDKTQTEPVSGS